MNRAGEMIKKCLDEKEMTQSELARGLGEDVRHLNQQMHRQDDMKVERYMDVLEHIGYGVDVVDYGGPRKICPAYAQKIIKTKEPKGVFWVDCLGRCVGIDTINGDIQMRTFTSKRECIEWLRSVAEHAEK